MAQIGSYKNQQFSESQKFLVLDPATGSTSLVLGSSLIDYITPRLNSVIAESTRLAAENTDYDVGTLIQTSGGTSPGDGLASVYLVVASGEGDFPMANGNDLLVVTGDDALREQLNDGIVRVDTLSDLQATTGRFSADAAYLMGRTAAGDGGEGEFRWDGSDLSSTLVTASVTSTSVDDTTDTITSAGHGLADGDGVTVDASVNGLTANALYWVVGATTDTFQLSASFGGAAVDLTGTTNFTTKKLLDPLQGVYVVSDRTGGNGAWVRNYVGPVHAEWFGVKKDGSDDSLAMNSALALGESVAVGAGTVSLANPVQIKYDGQALFGYGTYNTTLEWIGTDGTKNMVELWTGRRDLGDDSLSTTNQRLENFKISTKTGSDINNLIWIEAGCFHGWVEKIRGFDIRGGIPAEAILKLDSNAGQSYSVGMNFRDIVLNGGTNDDSLPIPIGIWIESIIEGYFESVKVYNTQIGWQLGSSIEANVRNVANTQFVHCHSEIGDRGFADGNGRALVIYQARNIQFNGCKIVAGADFGGPTSQVPIRFLGSSSGFQNKSILFDGCTLWDFEGNCGSCVQFTSTANYQGVSFQDTEFYQVSGPLITVTGDNVPTIYFSDSNTFVECEGTVSNFDLESVEEAGFTIFNAGGATKALQIGNETTQIKREEAILVGWNADTQGALFSAYKASEKAVEVRGYNRSGSDVVLSDGYWYARGIGPHNSLYQGYASFDPPSLSATSSASTTVTVLGAKLGDFVAVGFDQDCQDVNVFGYVSAEDEITVYFVNRTNSTRDLPEGKIKAYILGPIIDFSGKSTFNAPSLTANSGTTTTVSVPGAQVGDIAVFSLGVDQQGVIGYAWVSALNTVSVRLQNESGGTVDLASTDLRVGVIETPRSL